MQTNQAPLNCQINRPPEAPQEYLRQEHEQQIHEHKEKALEEDDDWNAEQALSYHMPRSSLQLQLGSAQVLQGSDVKQDMAVIMVLEQESDKEMMVNDTLPAANKDIGIQQDVELCMALDPITGDGNLGHETLAGEEEVVTEQDMEMMSAFNSTSGEKLLGQDAYALTLEPQARSQNFEHGQGEEKQVAILLGSGGGDFATGQPQVRSQNDQGKEQQVAILLGSRGGDSATGEQNCFILERMGN